MADTRLILRNEFGAVALQLHQDSCGPRLEVTDLEHGGTAHLDPLELASLCYWPEERRADLLIVGPYDPNGGRPADDEWDMG